MAHLGFKEHIERYEMRLGQKELQVIEFQTLFELIPAPEIYFADLRGAGAAIAITRPIKRHDDPLRARRVEVPQWCSTPRKKITDALRCLTDALLPAGVYVYFRS